jgi:hypothetical protein
VIRVGNKSRKNRGRNIVRIEVSPKTVNYTGPIQSSLDKEEQDLHTFCFGFAATCTSNGGGVIANVYGSSPSGASDWANLIACFEEFRVLGFEVRFFPNNRYSKSATTCTPLLGLVDRSSSAAISSYSAMMTHSSHKRLSLEDPWVVTAKMNSIEEAGFLSVGSAADLFWIKFYSTGLSLSTDYGQFFITYRVQFRGRA